MNERNKINFDNGFNSEVSISPLRLLGAVQFSFRIVPISLQTANIFVEKNHRHHKKVQGHKFSIGLQNNDKLIGVAICGRPVSRVLDDGTTLEVTRLCTDGSKNACSKLYSSCARIAKEMGYNKIITYILESENGSSLMASGWILDEKNVGGLCWKRNDGNRCDTVTDLFGTQKKYPNVKKQRWSKKLHGT